MARLNAGKTQADVARATGTSIARISRVERATVPALSFREAVRHAAAVGLRLWVRAFPTIRRLLDEPQLALLGRLRERVGDLWSWALEVPMPRPGDLRAADAVLSIPGCSIHIEAITRLADVQFQLRQAQVKRRDLGADRLMILVAATSTNREAVHAAGGLLRDALPLGTRQTLAALRENRDPGADMLVLL
jgi:transcriptional regulator with XRE-family HTH domain